MRSLTLAALSVVLVGCAAHAPGSVVVEHDTPMVSSNGTTTEALGVETLGGVFTPLIQTGSVVPCSVSETFSTAADGQTQIIVTLFRGTDPTAARNRALGRFQVVGIAAAPRGVPRVQVTFTIDGRTISLAARDLTREQELRIVRLADAAR